MTARFLFRLLLLCAPATGPAASADAAPAVQPGIDVLEDAGFRPLEGKNIGLLTHPAGVNQDGVSTVTILRNAPNVRLVALFGPEHGIYGNEEANQPIDDQIDPRTGLPVHSLYGRYRKPTDEMLRPLDALVVDLQDIGVRSYTYVSAMRYAMEACFENDVEFIVLDRPNPLGGLKTDGPPLDSEWRSYVGAFQVPYVHGLTLAELARIAKHTSGWLDVSERVRRKGKLTVIPMRGWERSMLWPETGLEWIPTSPNIPDLSAVLGYAMTGLGAQIGGFSHGIGTPHPFRLLRHPEIPPATLRRTLSGLDIPGLQFRNLRTRTKSGHTIEGTYVQVTNWRKLRPTELSFHMMRLAAARADGNPFAEARNSDLFNKHVGSTAWWEEIREKGGSARVRTFVEHWADQAAAFHRQSRRFWLY